MKTMKTMKTMETIGTFEIESGTVVVSDPCYEDSRALKGIKKGTWCANVIYNDGRCAVLVAYHKNHPVKNIYDNFIAEHFNVGVDSGQAGIFDSKYFRDDDVVKDVKRIGEESDQICTDESWYSVCCDRTLQKIGAGVIPFGCVSSSGYGDGVYECSTVKTNDEITAIKIDFGVFDEDEENDDDDDDDKNDWSDENDE